MSATSPPSAIEADVVLLGASGFLGRSLATHLSASGTSVEGISSTSIDLTSAEAPALLSGRLRPDRTLVFAAAVTPDRTAAVDNVARNVTIAVSVARALEKQPVRACVCFSSDAIYPMSAGRTRESSPPDPTNWYALGKYAAERIIQIVAEQRQIPLLILRPTGVFGAGDTHNSYGPNRFVRSIIADRRVQLFGRGEERRDHLYVEDVARATAQLMARQSTGAFNLASGTSRSFGSVVRALRRIAPYSFEVAYAPRRGPITHRRFDIRALTAALGPFEFTDFDAALRATFEGASARV